MTSPVENNIRTLDNIVYLIQQDDTSLASDTDNDSDDLHVCRKCNKVFQSLAAYLEHKVKYENYNISHTLSKLDQRMVLPHLVQTQKKNENNEELDDAGKNKVATISKLDDIDSVPALAVIVDCDWPLDKSSGKAENAAELKQNENSITDQAPKKRAMKRKSSSPDVPSTPSIPSVPSVPSTPSHLDVVYTCTECDRKFRREATLRWHINCGHKRTKENGQKSVKKLMGEDSADNNEKVFKIKKEETDDNFDGVKTEQEMQVVVYKTQNMDKQAAGEEIQEKGLTSRRRKQTLAKHIEEVSNTDSQRPHACDICGRSFKKMAALKTHGAVHSDDRKFVCTFKGCPYGFKLKGGLVRHMRRHTGERPYVCENCGRAFSESGALSRHMKSRQNCARTPGTSYPRYMKNWTYHPNIPAVIDPSQRDIFQGRNKVSCSFEDLEHNDKDRNCFGTQTRSMQVQTRQRKQENANDVRENKTVTLTKQNGVKSCKPTSHDSEIPASGREEVAELKKKKDLIEITTAKMRGKKIKSAVPEIPLAQSDLEPAYSCTKCGKHFRRVATLRRHMKYEHKDNQDESEVEVTGEVAADDDEDFSVNVGIEENEDRHFEKCDDKTQQAIRIITKQAQDTEKLETVDDLQEKCASGQPLRETVIKWANEAMIKDSSRPYMCDICGQRFKKMTALKTHGAVHSQLRKYVCTVKDCPYGFKLKGGLVRHMRRHTGERPYVCENCGRSFSESGALTRHMKSRRNCARTPDSAYHRYMRNWTYHPNIPAVMDPYQRRLHQGLWHEWNQSLIHEGADIVTVAGTEVMCEIVKPPHSAISQQDTSGVTTEQQILDNHGNSMDTSSHEHPVLYSSHVIDLADFNSDTDDQFVKLMQCRVCMKDLGTVEGLEIHLRSHLADQSARCGFCHFLSHDQEELRHHILSMHYDSLKDIEASVLSMTDEGGEMKNEATQDKKSTTRNALLAVKQLYSLKKHKSSMEDENDKSTNGRQQCMVCNRLFAQRSYLLHHMRTHTGDRPYKCHICQRSFTTRDILKNHMLVHKEQRDFKCEECGKLFKRLTYVQQHLKIHNEERNFRCSLCDKQFRTQYCLTVHMRTHSGINPYKCHVCSKQFRERGSLQRHMRLHAGEKPFKCHLCNRTFAENGTLSRHLKAKVPCTAKHTKHNFTRRDQSQASSSNMLTQFSAVVANTQQYIQHVDSSQQYIQHVDGSHQYIQHVDGTPQYIQHIDENQQFCQTTVQEGQETETLHIFDSDISESVIIVADKSIVEIIRE